MNLQGGWEGGGRREAKERERGREKEREREFTLPVRSTYYITYFIHG